VLGEEYKRLIRKRKKPRQLQKRHPELYDELKSYYKTDPIDWFNRLHNAESKKT